MFQSIHHLCHPVLDSIQEFHVFLVLANPELDPAVQMCLTNSECGKRVTSLAMTCPMHPTRLLVSSAAKGHYWVVVSLVSTRMTRASSVGMLPSLLVPRMHWIFYSQVEDLEFPLFELEFPQAVEVPLNYNTPTWHISRSSQWGIVCSLTRGVPSPIN